MEFLLILRVLFSRTVNKRADFTFLFLFSEPYAAGLAKIIAGFALNDPEIVRSVIE